MWPNDNFTFPLEWIKYYHDINFYPILISCLCLRCRFACCQNKHHHVFMETQKMLISNKDNCIARSDPAKLNRRPLIEYRNRVLDLFWLNCHTRCKITKRRRYPCVVSEETMPVYYYWQGRSNRRRANLNYSSIPTKNMSSLWEVTGECVQRSTGSSEQIVFSLS